jgi:hypothetical protein
MLVFVMLVFVMLVFVMLFFVMLFLSLELVFEHDMLVAVGCSNFFEFRYDFFVLNVHDMSPSG